MSKCVLKTTTIRSSCTLPAGCSPAAVSPQATPERSNPAGPTSANHRYVGGTSDGVRGLLRHCPFGNPINRLSIMERWRNNGRRGHGRGGIISVSSGTSRTSNDLQYNRSLACVPAIGAVLRRDRRCSRNDSTSGIVLSFKHLR